METEVESVITRETSEESRSHPLGVEESLDSEISFLALKSKKADDEVILNINPKKYEKPKD